MPRPKLNPTEDQRRIVKTMTAMEPYRKKSRRESAFARPRHSENIFAMNSIKEAQKPT
jgi:hypothetical protein